MEKITKKELQLLVNKNAVVTWYFDIGAVECTGQYNGDWIKKGTRRDYGMNFFHAWKEISNAKQNPTSVEHPSGCNIKVGETWYLLVV